VVGQLEFLVILTLALSLSCAAGSEDHRTRAYQTVDGRILLGTANP